MEDIKDRNNYYLFDNLHVNPSHTICLKGNIYNIEIKKAEKGGYKNIFVFNNNLKNSQVIVENKSNYEIIIKQKSFEKFKQKIKKYEIKVGKIIKNNIEFLWLNCPNYYYKYLYIKMNN